MRGVIVVLLVAVAVLLVVGAVAGVGTVELAIWLLGVAAALTVVLRR
ncbi:MAG: hypothetical protein AB7L84_12240 [Acidimicrobiia bacterium]